MAVRIRARQDDDIPQLLVVWRSAVEASHAFLTPDDVDWYAHVVSNYLPRMSDVRVAVQDDGRPVGFIAQEKGEIHMLFVGAQSQGTGVGSALLAHISETEPTLRLDVNEQNPTALAFYLSRGFEQVGRSELDGQGRPFPLLHLARERRAVIPLDDISTAAGALQPLSAREDHDPAWQRVASPTFWTAARTVEHVTDALLFYCGQVARRADRRLPVLRDGRNAPPSEHIDNVLTAASVLTALLRDLGSARAWHPSGSADASGWAGMAVTEILVHGVDAARGIGMYLALPADVCARTVARVFPWVDPTVAEPAALLLAVTGRFDLPGVPRDPDWWWQSAPLQEWDGRPRRRDTPPGWR